MDLISEMVLIYVFLIMEFNKNIYGLMNHLPIQVMNISEIKMLSLNVMEAGFLRLNMKYFKPYLLNNIYYFIYILKNE